MSKIKIVQLIHGLNTGGAETLVKNYALLLDKEKFDVIVLCFEHQNSPYEIILANAGIQIIFLCDMVNVSDVENRISQAARVCQLCICLKYELKKINPDVIHFHLELSGFVRFARPDPRTRIFYTQHSDEKTWCKKYPNNVKNLRWIICHYRTQVIGINAKMAKNLNKILNVTDSVYIENGIDLSLYNGSFDRCKKRRELKIPEDAFLVVHIGRFVPIKNHLFLLEVFECIKARKPNAYLLMVGSGSMEQLVREKIAKLGLTKCTCILKNRTDIPEILRASDAGVFPSEREGLGIAVVEMQAAGLPCVVSTGIPKDACVSNKLRFMSLEESTETWVDTLLTMWGENEPTNYFGLENWDIRCAVKKLEKMYEGA